MLYLFYLAVCFLVCCCLWNFSFHLQRYTKYLRIPNFLLLFWGCLENFAISTSGATIQCSTSELQTPYKIGIFQTKVGGDSNSNLLVKSKALAIELPIWSFSPIAVRFLLSRGLDSNQLSLLNSIQPCLQNYAAVSSRFV